MAAGHDVERKWQLAAGMCNHILANFEPQDKRDELKHVVRLSLKNRVGEHAATFDAIDFEKLRRLEIPLSTTEPAMPPHSEKVGFGVPVPIDVLSDSCW